ncbi:MAG TPA: heme-binding protein [Opitutaceae bacterium]
MASDTSSPASPSTAEIATAALKIIEHIEALFPEYLKNPQDAAISTGNLGVCIIDAEGHIYGRSLGPTPLRKRELFRVAWVKASQVWITGMKTYDYERKLFNGELEAGKHGGISNPDLIGWEGGQPITLKNGAELSIGVSGMRGINDLEIAVRAVAAAGV